MAVTDRLPVVVGGGSATSRFADRMVESEALRLSLEAHRHAIDSDVIDGRVMNNLLVFYGFAGVGKSTLSKKLEDWLSGRGVCSHTGPRGGRTCPEGCPEWGPPPTVPGVVTARWDLRDEESQTNPVVFYLRLRRALADAGYRTPRFDAGIVAMAVKFHPEGAEPLTDVMRIAESLIAELFPDWSPPERAEMRYDQRLLKLLKAEGAPVHDARRRITQAVGVITTGEADSIKLREAAGWVGWLLSDDLEQLEPEDRPLPVVFIDTFEVIEDERHPEREQMVNAVVGSLPFCLFVITGRERVDWATTFKGLTHGGAGTWPSLTRTALGDLEPRQHNIGELSFADAFDLLQSYLATIDARLDDGLCRRLATEARWPIHIDAIVTLARELAAENPGCLLVEEDLEGKIDRVVGRLLERYPEDKADLLQAAALVAQFDAPLLAAMTGVGVGTAQRFLTNPLVQVVRDKEHFQYHLHDEVRRIVNQAGTLARYAWSDADRTAAAQRGLDHLERELNEAWAAHDHERHILVHAAGYRLAVRVGLEPLWVISQFNKSPSRLRIARLLGPIDWGDSALVQTAYLNAVLAKGPSVRAAELRKFLRRDTTIAVNRTARLCLAYALRDKSDYQWALDLLRQLWEEESANVYASQIVVTCLTGRRYREGITEWLTLGEPAGLPMGRLMYNLGLPDIAVPMLEERICRSRERKQSEHFISQQRTVLAETRAWAGASDPAERDSIIEALEESYRESLQLERRDGQRYYWQWRGLRDIFDDDKVAEGWNELGRVTDPEGAFLKEERNARLVVAGLRLLATGDDTYVREVLDNPTDIPDDRPPRVDFLWEHLHDLGLINAPLPTLDTQWVGERETIKQRWIALFHRVIDDARARKGTK